MAAQSHSFEGFHDRPDEGVSRTADEGVFRPADEASPAKKPATPLKVLEFFSGLGGWVRV
jgi:hypothetical protein